MRIRVSTVPPLLLTKVWSSLSSLPSAATISTLKDSLCAQIPALKGLSSDQIRLFVDDFELLSTLPIDVVHENDLVNVGRVDPPSGRTSVLRKRKRSDSTASSSSSSSSSSSTSSSSSSESSSGSSSDSDESTPTFKAVKRKEQQQFNQRPFVPPGMGRPATHSRNTRRRRKLQYERNGVIQGSDDPTAGVNAIPLGDHKVTEAAPQLMLDGHGKFADVTMASLSNKNKRRGFKNAMGKEVPSRIIFSERVDPHTDANERVQAPAPRLVPPSEKQEKGLLPPNVFVTSVDVEKGSWPSKKSKPVVPDNKRSMSEIPAVGATGGFDQMTIQAKWDSLGLVSGVLATGTVVGWKALGINPATITPEVMLHVGTVVSCDESQVTVKFSDWAGSRLGSEEDIIEETHGWEDVVGQWRIVSV